MIKCVSTNTESEIELNRANKELRRALRSLAANVLRCAAGGGRDRDLADQCRAFLAALEARNTINSEPIRANSILNVPATLMENRPWIEDRKPYDDEDICKASMQIVASYLTDNLTQVARAESRLFDAIKDQGFEKVAPSRSFR